MRRSIRTGIGLVWLVAALLLSRFASAQQAPGLDSGYSLAREVNLVGTVSSVDENSKTGPLGTNLMVQTGSGLIDVHIGSANYLKVNHLELASGDSVRIIGETFSSGSGAVFLARIVQKGTVAVAVRSSRGMPLWRNGTRFQAASKTQSQGDVL